MRVPANRKVGKIGKGRAASLPIDFTSRCVATEDLRDFNVKQVRRVQGLPRLTE
jgi:hypothetical protein